MKKCVIIGAGAAGLSLAIYLRRINIEVEVYERNSAEHNSGLAFMMLENGYHVIQDLGLEEELIKHIRPLSQFDCRFSNGKGRDIQQVTKMFGLKRADLINTLKSALTDDIIRYDHQFSHFQYDGNGNAIGAVFNNGTVATGDMFIGGDGVRSNVRKILFPNATNNSTRVKEIVSLIKAPKLAQRLDGTFLKIKCKAGGRAAGLLPVSKEDVVWFFQFDTGKIRFKGSTPMHRKAFLIHQVGFWANPIPELIEKTDFSNSYLWNTFDLDPLPQYYHNNIGLIGDAAHVFLTFTSQGMNSALEDAQCMSRLINSAGTNNSANEILQKFTALRKPIAEEYLRTGRALQEHFIDLQSYEDKTRIPLAV